MIAPRKRGTVFHADFCIGRVHVVRGSLGVSNRDAAMRLCHRLELALSEGPRSEQWSELRALIPPETFDRFAKYVGAKRKLVPTWKEFRESFELQIDQRLKTKNLAPSTVEGYKFTLRELQLFLDERSAKQLCEIDEPCIEIFKLWRLRRIKPVTRGSDGTSTLRLDIDRLHHVFAFAVEKGLIEKNPVRFMGKRRDASRSTRPFNKDELHAMRKTAGADLLLFLLLRWTGLRRSDVVRLTWQEIDFNQGTIEHICLKNNRRVNIPVHEELMLALATERQRRSPQPDAPVLLLEAADAADGPGLFFTQGCERTEASVERNRMSRAERQLYHRVVALGCRAGVHDARPHRFRCNLGVDLLLKGENDSTVARILADDVNTVITHYLPFVEEIRERVRISLNNGSGIEDL